MKQSLLSFFLASTAGSTMLQANAQADMSPSIDPRLKIIVSAVSEGWHMRQHGSSDSALLLSNTAGYSVAQAGGVSGLPVLNGLGDDRLKIRIDGMEITSACANHMNAPLSYIAPTQIGRIEVLAGVTPVSSGGDSIGGTVAVKSAAPVFAGPGEGMKSGGKATLSGRSNGDAINGGIAVSTASEVMSIGYNAAYARGHSYEDGVGRRVLGSQYESINQALILAFRDQHQQLTLRAGLQHIPYQGFPNQYMDMTDNSSRFANLAYLGRFAWGEVDASAYHQTTDHTMGFFSPERTGAMPMVTHGRNAGYALKASLPLGELSQLRLGQEYHTFRLDDFWPAVPGSMMMGPQTYVNINGGARDRVALYGEIEMRHYPLWTSLLGARWESVRMDTGKVQPYADNMMNMKDAAAAAGFNARAHQQRDGNLDLTALTRFDASNTSTYEFAAARKTRSPNLYERYTWGRGSMAMTMTNWFGDANGYVGNLDLQPETAYTLSMTGHWHGGSDATAWFIKVQPYFTRVQDYIDVDVLGTFNPYMNMRAQGALLQFANHDARLYGSNLSWSVPLTADSAIGALSFTGNAAYTRGKRIDGGNLYHMMPLNALLTLEHALGAWHNQIETKIVARKAYRDARRLEPGSAGYALLNLRTRYQLRSNAQLVAGINNLLDKNYADPLGGIYLSGAKAQGGALTALPGYGRSVDIGLTVSF
ncbi:MAG: TonB-dependent receptor domain-containing protein [Sphingomonadaceae bacterium]